MKSDIDIKDDVFKHVKGSVLESTVSGILSKTRRPENSDKEDIVISILSNQNGQIQEAFVNVNIYVSDIIKVYNTHENEFRNYCQPKRKEHSNLSADKNLVSPQQWEENTSRLRELCKISHKLLKVGRGNDYRFTLDTQRVMKVNGKNEHFINNKLLYRQCNE